LVLRAELDHAGLGTIVKGKTSMTVSMSHPSTVTENNVTLEIPTPSIRLSSPWHET
jgi:hypothetical protein